MWAGEACGESVEKSMDHEHRESMKPGPIRANPEEELTPSIDQSGHWICPHPDHAVTLSPSLYSSLFALPPLGAFERNGRAVFGDLDFTSLAVIMDY